MSEFYVGQKVKFIAPTGIGCRDAVNGHIYTVSRIEVERYDRDRDMIHTVEGVACFAYRFSPVETLDDLVEL